MSTLKTFRFPDADLERLEELAILYNRSATEILLIALDSLYKERPNIKHEPYGLLEVLKVKISNKFGLSVAEYANKNGYTSDDFYRTIRQLDANKTIKGFGCLARPNRSSSNDDKIYSTVTAEIANLLETDFGSLQ